jgi:sRNA-binding carbon storage regulator CsrA
MLVLTVKLLEKVIVLLPNGDEMILFTKKDKHGNYRMCFEAPNTVQIWRDSLYQKIVSNNGDNNEIDR